VLRTHQPVTKANRSDTLDAGIDCGLSHQGMQVLNFNTIHRFNVSA
jgi:hypothetical protein